MNQRKFQRMNLKDKPTDAELFQAEMQKVIEDELCPECGAELDISEYYDEKLQMVTEADFTCPKCGYAWGFLSSWSPSGQP